MCHSCGRSRLPPLAGARGRQHGRLSIAELLIRCARSRAHLTARRFMPAARTRLYSISTDGGGTWANHRTNEPSNCRSIARYSRWQEDSDTRDLHHRLPVEDNARHLCDSQCGSTAERIGKPFSSWICPRPWRAQRTSENWLRQRGSNSKGIYAFTNLEKKGSFLSPQ